MAICEILRSTSRTKEYVQEGEREGKSLIDAMSDGQLEGMQTFDGELEKLINAGVIDKETGLSYATNRTNLQLGWRRAANNMTDEATADRQVPAASAPSQGGVPVGAVRAGRPDREVARAGQLPQLPAAHRHRRREGAGPGLQREVPEVPDGGALPGQGSGAPGERSRDELVREQPPRRSLSGGSAHFRLSRLSERTGGSLRRARPRRPRPLRRRWWTLRPRKSCGRR